MLYKIVEEINGLEVSLGREFMNTFQSSHFVQLFNFKKRNPQGRPVFFRRRPEEVSTQRIFSYILENAKETMWSIVRMCRTLKVSETGFYKWKRNRNKIKSRQLLPVEIHKILSQDPENDNYGIGRIMLALEQRGIKVSRSTVIRAMRKGNLLHKSRRSPDGLTKADKKAQRPENLLRGDFSSDAPNKKWLTDITQVPCKDGKLYIAPIMDYFAGEIITVAMDDNMKKELCIRALKEAYELRKPDDYSKFLL